MRSRCEKCGGCDDVQCIVAAGIAPSHLARAQWLKPAGLSSSLEDFKDT